MGGFASGSRAAAGEWVAIMKLSAIVCTRNRAHAIISCLESLLTSIKAAMPVDAEIIVVDNASEDDTSALVKDWARHCPVPVNLQFEPRRGLAIARNCGLRAAKGDVIAFTDDDCRWSETFVQEWLAHATAETGPVLRGGRVELGDPTDLPLSIRTSREKKCWSKAMRSARYESLFGCLIGANMSMNRAALNLIGPFDERLNTRGLSASEDIDCVFRAYLAGVTIEYVPDMVVYHFHGRKQLDHGHRQMRNYMIGTGALYAKYLFKDVDLCRPAYWDMKKAIKEIFTGGNTFRPEIDFSYRLMMYCLMVGVLRYLTQSFRKTA